MTIINQHIPKFTASRIVLYLVLKAAGQSGTDLELKINELTTGSRFEDALI